MITKKPAWPVFFVPEAGLEPAQPQWPKDFKSFVSTYSTTRAIGIQKNPDVLHRDVEG